MSRFYRKRRQTRVRCRPGYLSQPSLAGFVLQDDFLTPNYPATWSNVLAIYEDDHGAQDALFQSTTCLRIASHRIASHCIQLHCVQAHLRRSLVPFVWRILVWAFIMREQIQVAPRRFGQPVDNLMTSFDPSSREANDNLRSAKRQFSAARHTLA